MSRVLLFTSGVRGAGLPRSQYRAHFALFTALGTRSLPDPLTDRRPRVTLVLLFFTVISWRRNFAASVEACVISVLSWFRSSLRSSRRNRARRALIFSASAFGPVNPSRWSSAYLA